MLHGKVIKTHTVEIEQQPSVECLAEALLRGTHGEYFSHRLVGELEALERDVYTLERRRVLCDPDKARNLRAAISDVLQQKLTAARVTSVATIPGDLTVTLDDIAPELEAERATLGVFDIPGVGSKIVAGWDRWFTGGCPYVELTVEEVLSVTVWPFTELGIRVKGLTDTDIESCLKKGGGQHAPLFEDTDEGRWGRVIAFLAERHKRHQQRDNYPKNEKVSSPEVMDPPATPGPVTWGYDLVSGTPFVAYAALYHEVIWSRGSTPRDCGWNITWHDDSVKAAEVDAVARAEAASFCIERRIKEDIASGVLDGHAVLQDFGGHFRRMGRSGNCDHWVIGTDGLRRTPTHVTYRRGHSAQGEKRWRFVGDEELALSWGGGDEGHVIQLPKVLTPAQRKAVCDIEREIGHHHVFNLSSEEGWRREKLDFDDLELPED